MTQSTPKSKSPLLPILVTVFLDMVGVGIIIPVIPALFFEESSTFFASDVSRDFRSLVFGLLLASFPFMQFFGAPLLGSLSDRYGRKPMLMISLIGTMIGYLLFAFSISQGSLWLMFISRMLPGFFGGNISIVYSAMADITEEKDRPRNFGLVSMMFGIGFIIGPTLGGVLADDTVLSWFTPATPFWFTAVLTACNILLVHFKFKETLPVRQASPLNLFVGFRNVAKAMQEADLRSIFSVVLLHALGFSFYTQFFAVYLIEGFGYSEKEIGFLFAWVGVWLVLTQAFVVGKVSRMATPEKVLTFTLFALSVTVAAVLIPNKAWLFYVINPFIALAQGLTSPNLTTVVSTQVGPDRQGEMLGIQQSMRSVGLMVPPLIGGYLLTFSNQIPIITASVVILLGWGMYVISFRNRRH